MNWTFSRATVIDDDGTLHRISAAIPSTSFTPQGVLYSADGEAVEPFAQAVSDNNPAWLP